MTRRELIVALLAAPFLGTPAAAQPGDLTSLTIAQAVARLTTRDISSLQLTDAYLTRIASLNTDLNAFITVTAAHAREDAKRATQGPLRGIPVAHKDLFETAGAAESPPSTRSSGRRATRWTARASRADQAADRRRL